VPASYGYKARLVGASVADVCRDAELLYAGLNREAECLGSDAVVVGVDLYNIEAEAMGADVVFPEDSPRDTPWLRTPPLTAMDEADLATLRTPDPATDGRMPMLLSVAERAQQVMGDDVWVRGAVSAPFSMAVCLFGLEPFLMALMERPDVARRLIDFCTRVATVFGAAWRERDVDVVLFDSYASPDVLSPSLYDAFAVEATREVVDSLRARGAPHVPLVIGGRTEVIAESCIATGASNLLCDFSADWPAWLQGSQRAGRAIRRNLDPVFLRGATPEAVHARARRMMTEAEGFGGFILGTGVVDYDTPLENLLALHEACAGSRSRAYGEQRN